MSYENPHLYDKQCGCKHCTAHELALQYAITAEPELLVEKTRGVLSREHEAREQRAIAEFLGRPGHFLFPIIKR